MGLDIYKYRVVKKGTLGSDKQIFDDSTKNEIAFFEHFKDFVVYEDIEYYDWEKTFESLGYDENNYEWIYQRYNDEKEDTEFGYKEIGTDKEISIFNSQCIPVIRSTPVLYIKNDNDFYQRKQMSTEFYSHYLGGCWYVAESAIPLDEGIRFAFTQELVDRAKEYADDGSPIKDLVLGENEFIYFCA